jgi:hypothetical protein
VAVAARVVGDTPVAALIAFLDMSAQRGRPAAGQVLQGTPLRCRERVAVRLLINPFSPAILMPSLVRSYTLVTISP